MKQFVLGRILSGRGDTGETASLQWIVFDNRVNDLGPNHPNNLEARQRGHVLIRSVARKQQTTVVAHVERLTQSVGVERGKILHLLLTRRVRKSNVIHEVLTNIRT